MHFRGLWIEFNSKTLKEEIIAAFQVYNAIHFLPSYL